MNKHEYSNPTLGMACTVQKSKLEGVPLICLTLELFPPSQKPYIAFAPYHVPHYRVRKCTSEPCGETETNVDFITAMDHKKKERPDSFCFHLWLCAYTKPFFIA